MAQKTIRIDDYTRSEGSHEYSFEFPVTFRKKENGVSFTKAQFIIHIVMLLFSIWLFAGLLYSNLNGDLRNKLVVLLFVGFGVVVLVFAVLSIIPDFLVDSFEGGSEITIFEDGVTDTRISNEKLDWINLTDPKIVRTSLKGIVLVRLSIKKGVAINYRRFRYDILFQKYFAPIRNRYVYLLIRNFNEDPSLIAHAILYAHSVEKI